MEQLILDTPLEYLIFIVLIVHLIMALIAAILTWSGPNATSRLVGLDLASTLTIAILIIISIIKDNSIFMDIAIAAAALGYLSTIAIAKFISDQKVF
jgi:multicomponent Na+:H+ antiporter subunit F